MHPGQHSPPSLIHRDLAPHEEGHLCRLILLVHHFKSLILNGLQAARQQQVRGAVFCVQSLLKMGCMQT